MADLARETEARMRAGMEDDLNTAQAQAAVFDMVRKANVAMDAGDFRQSDAPLLLAALQKFDEIFAVLDDDDAPKMQSILDWANSEGREGEISPELLDAVKAQQLSDRAIEEKIVAMNAARVARDFKSSDAIRDELASAGVIVEITKDGIRWKRK
jgi:cysteinyl-tRNA synthetase